MSFITTPLNYYSEHPDNPFAIYRKLHQLDPMRWYKDRWGGDPKDFVWSNNYTEYAKHEWDGTKDPLFSTWDSVARFQNVAASAATAMGKTYLASIMVFWFLDVFPNSIVITTSTKFSQLQQTLWREIKGKYGKFKSFYPHVKASWGNKLQISLEQKDYFGNKDHRYIYGKTEQVSVGEEVSVSAAGMHAEYMLILMDEGSGIAKSILEAYINTCTGPGNVICMLGNPVNNLDTLYYFSNKSTVKSVQMSALDHPNYVCRKEIIPGGTVSVKSIQDRLLEYGDNHPIYLARVRGISPKETKNALLKLDEIEKCYKIPLDKDYREDGEKSVGIDVANSIDGDKACVAMFEGDVLTYLKDFTCPDANAIALNMLLEQEELDMKLMSYDDGIDRFYDLPNIEEHNIWEEDIMVDAVGVGVGTINEFAEHRFNVGSFAGGAKPMEELIPLDDNGDKMFTFYNLRSQAFYLLMQDIKAKRISLDIPKDMYDRLSSELAAFKSDIQAAGRGFKLELKSLTKRRIMGDSPNLADAVILANLSRRLKLEGVNGGYMGVHI